MSKALYKRREYIRSRKTNRVGIILAVVPPGVDPYDFKSLTKVPKTVFKDAYQKKEWSYVIRYNCNLNSMGNKDPGYGWLLEKNVEAY
jgi:hypothetical protein